MAYAQIGTFSNSRKIINYSVGIFVNLFILRAGYINHFSNSSLCMYMHAFIWSLRTLCNLNFFLLPEHRHFQKSPPLELSFGLGLFFFPYNLLSYTLVWSYEFIAINLRCLVLPKPRNDFLFQKTVRYS